MLAVAVVGTCHGSWRQLAEAAVASARIGTDSTSKSHAVGVGSILPRATNPTSYPHIRRAMASDTDMGPSIQL